MPSDRLTILQGDARNLPLADDSVDLIITSPPFLNLRSYQDAGGHMDGQIGVGSRDDFMGQLWEATAEMVRVLKPSGSIFVELGDSYTNKSLNLSPHRYAIGCTDRLGLILRSEIIWSRPNGLPESVTDRVRRSHSVWFHFTLSPRYYSAVDEIREPHAGEFLADGVTRNPRHKYGGIMPNEAGGKSSTSTPDRWSAATGLNPLGKLPGSVWTIATEPLRVPPELGIDHFAAFPSEWPRRLVLGWSPREVCTACGEGRRPVSERTLTANRKGRQSQRDMGTPIGGGEGTQTLGWERVVTITGFACACSTGSYEWMSPGSVSHLVIRGLCATCGNGPHPLPSATPGVVLDPFGGTGTTAHVASALGRRGISVDLSADYCRLAEHPFLQEKRAAKVLGAKPVRKKPPVVEADVPPRFVDEPLFDLGDGEAA